MRVTALIINYHTEAFLPALIKVLEQESCIKEILIGDNGSSCGAAALQALSPKVRVHAFSENLGFGAAVNACVQQDVQTLYTLLLNPDTLPVPGFADRLLETALKTGALITAPRCYLDAERRFRLPPFNGYEPGDSGPPEQPAEVLAHARAWTAFHENHWAQQSAFEETFVSGACMMLHTAHSFFDGGQVFDPRFFMYFEDADLCLRARQAGCRIVTEPAAEVTHFWDQSPRSSKGSYMAAAQQQFFDKYPDYGPHFFMPALSIPDAEALYGVSCTDAGELSAGQLFRAEDARAGDYFELGINAIFIPFAQAVMTDSSFRLPDGFAEKLPQGSCFFRIRSPQSKIRAFWTSTKR
ncbi:MAG: glycosyltransferase [Balneolales bacterium]|nr:glycosyltransferase [Balneolales bacterium]